MTPLDAPLVARDVWLSAEDGTTPADQSAAHFVLRMFDGYPDDEAIFNAIAARLTRELAYRKREREKERHDDALATFRADNPWMETIANRLWPGHWTWVSDQVRGQAPTKFHVHAWCASRYSGATITMRHEGWVDGGESDGTHDTPRQRGPGVFISGMALDGRHVMLAARSPSEMVATYRTWLDTATIYRRGYMGPVAPTPRSRAGRDLAAWRQLEADGADGLQDVEKRVASLTPSFANEYFANEYVDLTRPFSPADVVRMMQEVEKAEP